MPENFCQDYRSCPTPSTNYSYGGLSFSGPTWTDSSSGQDFASGVTMRQQQRHTEYVSPAPEDTDRVKRLPKLKCSKFLVVGNPKMRKRRLPRDPVMWKTSPRRKRDRPLAIRGGENLLDQHTIYSKEKENMYDIVTKRDDLILPPLEVSRRSIYSVKQDPQWLTEKRHVMEYYFRYGGRRSPQETSLEETSQRYPSISSERSTIGSYCKPSDLMPFRSVIGRKRYSEMNRNLNNLLPKRQVLTQRRPANPTIVQPLETLATKQSPWKRFGKPCEYRPTRPVQVA